MAHYIWLDKNLKVSEDSHVVTVELQEIADFARVADKIKRHNQIVYYVTYEVDDSGNFLELL